MNLDWVDNADSFFCPVCHLEVNNPAKYHAVCPNCGFIPTRLRDGRLDLIDRTALLEDIEAGLRFTCRTGVDNLEVRGANKVISLIERAKSFTKDEEYWGDK